MKKEKIMFKLVDEHKNGDVFESIFPTLRMANGEANCAADWMSAREKKKHHIYVVPIEWSTDKSEWAAFDEEEGGFWKELPCNSEYNRNLIAACFNDRNPLIDIDHDNDGMYITVREAVKVCTSNAWIKKCRDDEMQDFEIVDEIIDNIVDEMRKKGLYLFDYEQIEIEKRLKFEVKNL